MLLSIPHALQLELLHDQVGLAQWMRCSEPFGSDAGLQRLTASPSCSLDESKPSLTGGRQFGSTALPLLFGVPTLGSDAAGLQGLRLTASPRCSLVGSQPIAWREAGDSATRRSLSSAARRDFCSAEREERGINHLMSLQKPKEEIGGGVEKTGGGVGPQTHT